IHDGAGGPVMVPVGGVILGDHAAVDVLARSAAAVPTLARDVARLTPETLLARLPGLAKALAGARFEAALYSTGCGVVDIHAPLMGLAAKARAHGATIHAGVDVTGVLRDGDRVVGVTTAAGAVHADVVVNAAGFRANQLAAFAGLPPLPFDP